MSEVNSRHGINCLIEGEFYEDSSEDDLFMSIDMNNTETNERTSAHNNIHPVPDEISRPRGQHAVPVEPSHLLFKNSQEIMMDVFESEIQNSTNPESTHSNVPTKNTSPITTSDEILLNIDMDNFENKHQYNRQHNKNNSSLPENVETGNAEARNSFTRNYDGQVICKIVTPRRFPGPAGLIPNHAQQADKNKNKESNQGTSSQPDEHAQPISQIYSSREFDSVLENRTWSKLNAHLKLDGLSETPLSGINISWIKHKFKRGCSINKIPFLTAMIRNSPDVNKKRKNEAVAPSCTLVDSSGTCQVALDVNFLQVYGHNLVPGTALALRNIGLLETGKRKFVLTVTARNVICIICQTDPTNHENELKRKKLDTTKNSSSILSPILDKIDDDGDRLIQFCEFEPEKLMRITLAVEDEAGSDTETTAGSVRRVPTRSTNTRRAENAVNSSTLKTTVNSNLFVSNRGLEG